MKFFSVDDRLIIAGRSVKKISGAFGIGEIATPAKEAYPVCPHTNSGSDGFGCVIDLMNSVAECQKLINDFIEEERISMTLMKAIEAIRHETGFDPGEYLKIEIRQIPETPSLNEGSKELQREEMPRVSQAPKNYRGWNLTSRGKNKKGEALFNLAKKIGGKKQQKYLGLWNQEKADRIIDEMSRNDGNEKSENNL